MGRERIFSLATFGCSRCLYSVSLEFPPHALCVFGLECNRVTQCFVSLVQGSELYNSMGTFQSSASTRTSDLPTNSPNYCTNVCSASTTPAVGPRRPLLVFSFAHSITSECGGMLIVSTVSAKHSLLCENDVTGWFPIHLLIVFLLPSLV